MKSLTAIEKKDHMINNTYGSFILGGIELAINVKAIQQVVNYPEKIISMPLSPNFLIGVFNLRSLIIPIINLKRLLKFDHFQVTGLEKIAIVEHMGVRVGLIFDSTSEIIRVKEENQNNFNYSEESGPNVISGAIKLDEGARILQLLDPFAVISIENIPQVASHQQNTLKSSFFTGHLHENRKKCISFNVSEIVMAFDISAIHEIVKGGEIQHSTFETEICLGIINLRGQIVPIINFAEIVGINQCEIKNISETRIIVLKLEQELFGIMVDSVESISTYMTTEIIPMPIFQNKRVAMFKGCIPIEGRDILLLDPVNILSNEEILSITRGHSKIYKSDRLLKEETKKNISKREAYITFKLNHLFGVSIKDIREIIAFPDNLLSAPGLPSFVSGLYNLRGEMVTVINTRILYGFDDKVAENIDLKILIFVYENEKYGLIVDSVESIIAVDCEQKFKVPGLLTQQVEVQFGNDIKEIITVVLENNREGALIILNISTVMERIQKSTLGSCNSQFKSLY